MIRCLFIIVSILIYLPSHALSLAPLPALALAPAPAPAPRTHPPIHPPFRLIVYDHLGSSGGFCALAFPHLPDMLREAFTTLMECDCDDKCPACCLSLFCSEFNASVCKEAGKVILSWLVRGVGLGAAAVAIVPDAAGITEDPMAESDHLNLLAAVNVADTPTPTPPNNDDDVADNPISEVIFEKQEC